LEASKETISFSAGVIFDISKVADGAFISAAIIDNLLCIIAAKRKREIISFFFC
jgi:hypothetical protein